MARIITKGSDLEKELAFCQKQATKKGIGAFLLFVACIISGLILFNNDYMPILSIIPLIFGIAMVSLLASITPIREKIEILSAGIEGEKTTKRCFSLLSDEYTVFCDLTVFYRDGRSEIDALIIGPTGVFVIEIKNLKGTIIGRVEEKHWIQHKVGRGGTPYSKSFYSPVKQVGTHVYRVANLLRESGVRTNVNAAVYFSNIDTKDDLFGSDPKTPIFFARNDGANGLLEYIVNNSQRLSQTECKKSVELFYNL